MRHALTPLVLLFAGCLVGENPSHPPPPPHPTASGSGLFGINMSADGAGIEVASDLGAAWVRLELVDGIAPPIAAYHARGMSVLLIVDYASQPGFHGEACADWPAYRSAWLARVGAAAQDLGDQVDAWEIWNEPDQPQLPCNAPDYNPGMPASEYGTLLRDAAAQIRGAGAHGTIVTGGLDSGQAAYATVAAPYADAVAIHPYGVVPDASWCPDPGEDLNCDWGTLGGKADEYQAATQLPVWITEFGVKTADTRHEADYITGAYRAFARPSVAHAFVFCESDAMVKPFGLTYADHSPKPGAYAAYQTAAHHTTTTTTTHAMQLHGTIVVGATPLVGLAVSAWGQNAGDFHETMSDAGGIYAFTGLDPDSRYNLVVNAQFDAGAYDTLDPAHDQAVRDNVELVAGSDGWHGEDFQLAR